MWPHYCLCIFNTSGSGSLIALYLLFNMSCFDRASYCRTSDFSRLPFNNVHIQKLWQYDKNCSLPVAQSLTRGKTNANPICPTVHSTGWFPVMCLLGTRLVLASVFVTSFVKPAEASNQGKATESKLVPLHSYRLEGKADVTSMSIQRILATFSTLESLKTKRTKCQL